MDPTIYGLLKKYIRNLLGGEDLQSTYAKKSEVITRNSLSNYVTRTEMNQEIRRLLGMDVMKGDPGDSAYDLAVAAGFNGTEAAWIASLKGEPGDSPYINNEGYWVVNGVATDIAANDYNSLTNKPTVNNNAITGDISALFNEKADASSVENTYATKTEVANTYATQASLANYAPAASLADYATLATLNDYATNSSVSAQIAAIPAYDDTMLATRVTSLESAVGAFVSDNEINDIIKTYVDNHYYVRTTKTVFSKNQLVEALNDNELDAMTIILGSNIDLGDDVLTFPNKTIIVNFNNHVIKGNANRMIVFENGIFTLEGGEIHGQARVIDIKGGSVIINNTNVTSVTNNAIDVRGPNAELIINSGTMTGREFGVNVVNGATVTINGGTLRGLDNFGLGGNGHRYIDNETGLWTGNATTNGIANNPPEPITVNINGGNIEGNIFSAGYIATAIHMPNAGTLNVNGGIIKGACGIVQRGGTVNIGPNAIIIANGPSGIKGKTGDSRTVVGPYAIVFDTESDYPDRANMALNIAHGATLVGTDGGLDVLPTDATTGITDNR